MKPHDEALHRIHEAKETGAEVLDLGDLDLDVLPEELGELAGLRVLGLGRRHPKFDDAGQLLWERDESRSLRPLNDLGPLRGLASLNSLDLSGCEGLVDIAPLRELASLNSLGLNACKGLMDLKPLRGLNSLTSLDLSWCLNLTDLGPLRGLNSLTSLDLSECESLNEIGPLRGLNSLTSLRLNWCRALKDIEPLRGLASLAILDLGGCDGLVDIGPLRGLNSLTSLDLSGWRGLENLEPLSGMNSLTSLSLSQCEGLNDIGPLRDLNSLTWLNLSACGRLNDIGPLRGLNSLTSLGLSWCVRLEDIGPLRGLASLNSLNLSNCFGLVDLGPLRGLASLNSLVLRECESLKDLEPLRGLASLNSLVLRKCKILRDLEPLRGLASLNSLDLSECKGLVDIEPLRGLASLNSLDLRECEGLVDLGDLRGLASLTSLNLRGCRSLVDLGPLRGLASLTSLNLRGCRSLVDLGPLRGLASLASLNLGECTNLVDLGPLCGLASLASLNLENCGHLGSFGPILERLPTLSELFLEGSTFTDLAPEVYAVQRDPGESRYPPRNVIDQVRANYHDLERGAQDDCEIKIFVLGNGGVGKSHLCHRFEGNRYPDDPAIIPSTHGIRIAEFDFPIEDQPPARVHLWDFGGQEIYHGSHALFLQQRAVFLVLWTPDRESGKFLDGVPMRHRPLDYWLDYIRNVAGVKAPVIVVQGQCDDDDQIKPLPCPPPTDFPFFRALAVSSKTGLGLPELRGVIGGAIAKLFRNRLPKIGVGRVEVRRRLRELARTRHTLGLDEFRDLCRGGPGPGATGAGSDPSDPPNPEAPPVSNPEAFLAFLHECGVVFHKEYLFDSRIILDQNWALEAIYTLLDRGKTLPVLDRHGRFTRETLKTLIWPDKTDSDCDVLIDMMRSCGICFEAKRGEYVAPELLPPYSDALGPMLASLRDDPKHLGFVVEYPFLHDGILRDMLSRLGNLAGDLAIYWKYGCWFRESRHACDVIIESAFDGDRGHVTARAWGRDRKGVLRSLHELMSHHGLAIEPTTRFLNFAGFDERREPAALVAGPPDPATAGQQVYLSYAWGEDATEIGRLREEAAKRTIERLRAEGYKVTYDRKDMRPGDLISDFIRRIGTAPDVVAILSQKYFESPYCVKELYSLFMHGLRDKSAFQRSLHPIPLADAHLGDWKTYKQHWEEKKAEVEDTYPHGSDGGVLTSLEITHWLLDLTTILSHLRDKLSPSVADDDLDALIGRALAMLRGR